MLKIRMKRAGKATRGRHQFKIVVIEATRSRDSRFIDQVGTYDPGLGVVKFNLEKYEDWVRKGVRPSDTVASLFKKYKKQLTASAQ